MSDMIAWFILASTLILGAIGTLVPGLPGAFLIAFGVGIHKFLMPEVLSWWTVSGVVILSLLTGIVDFMGTYWGAKIGGSTKAGLIGAGIGGFFGIFLGPLGLIIGPFFGAILGDLYAQRKKIAQLIRSGLGAAAGFFISLALRIIFLIGIGIIIIFNLILYAF